MLWHADYVFCVPAHQQSIKDVSRVSQSLACSFVAPASWSRVGIVYPGSADNLASIEAECCT